MKRIILEYIASWVIFRITKDPSIDTHETFFSIAEKLLRKLGSSQANTLSSALADASYNLADPRFPHS